VNHPEQPVNFIFAGKAHPHDKAGQDLIKRIVDISRKPQFTGKIIFLENYDMILAKKLVSGCDVWLNTPTRPLEASGTSGEKAVMNGVLNFSVLDGWWAEGYREDAGWAINEEITYQDNKLQDEMDAVMIYSMLEEQIAPAFYTRNESGIPEKWVMMMKNNFAKIAPHFTMKRQLDDYYRLFYHTLEKQSDTLQNNQMETVFDIVKWKKKMFAHWENIEVVDLKMPDMNNPFYSLGESLFFEISLLLGNLLPEDIGIEIVFTTKNENKKMKFAYKIPFEFVETKDQTAIFRCNIKTDYVGVWNLAIRIKPQHPLLPHKTCFDLTKWI
jgi:phosphorylase/glycogen(starch) synthase